MLKYNFTTDFTSVDLQLYGMFLVGHGVRVDDFLGVSVLVVGVLGGFSVV